MQTNIANHIKLIEILLFLFSSSLQHFSMREQSEEGTSQLRIRIISGQSLAKKDIFGAR